MAVLLGRQQPQLVADPAVQQHQMIMLIGVLRLRQHQHHAVLRYIADQVMIHPPGQLFRHR